MQSTQFVKLVAQLNLSNESVAAICGVTDRQVRNWINGATELPRPVEIILTALADGELSEEYLAGLIGKMDADELG